MMMMIKMMTKTKMTMTMMMIMRMMVQVVQQKMNREVARTISNDFDTKEQVRP